MEKKGYIAVDFDATLSHYEGWKGDFTFGPPIPKMVERVKKWLEAGQTVKIMTARACELEGSERQEVVNAINKWCLEHIGQKLEVTNKKDYAMLELWDDRAKQVIPNTGESVEYVLAQYILENGALKDRIAQLEAEQLPSICDGSLGCIPTDHHYLCLHAQRSRM